MRYKLLILVILLLYFITIPTSAAYFANFVANKTNFSIPLAAQFTNSSTNFTGTGQGWTWFFGDGDYTEPWIEENDSSGWDIRYLHRMVVLQNGSIELLGGSVDFYGNQNDVWITANNGTRWSLINGSVAWSNRSLFAATVSPVDGNIFISGGHTGVPDVWRSTDGGKIWTEMNASIGANPLVQHEMVALHDGSILIMGGFDGGYGAARSTDDGATWTIINSSAFWVGMNAYASALSANDVIYVINDNSVWMSTDKGYTWTQTGSGFTLGQNYPCAISMPDNSIVYISGDSNRIWRSVNNGTNWSLINSTFIPINRYGFYAVLNKYGKILLTGGQDYTGGTYYNDTWSFNPSDSVSKNPVHTYSDIGNYTVGLIAYNSSVYNITTKLKYIVTNPVLGTTFTANPTIGTAPLNVSFTDTTVGGTPTTWNWSFGDGTYSALRNPYHVYSSAGTYVATLRSSNTYQSGNYTMNISVGGGYPIAQFTTDVTYGQAALDVQFTDTSLTTDPTTYSWNFGDGGTSTLQNPLHTFIINGDYGVTLTVTDAVGVDTSNVTVIHVSSSLSPFVDFTANTTDFISAPASVQFTDLTTNIVLSSSVWNWSFGDGTYSILQNPSHTYSSNGQYTVQLVVSNATFSNYTTKLGYINVGINGDISGSGGGIVYANFTATPLSGSTPLTVVFTDRSVCNPICNNWNWDLNGDGAIDSVAQNPTYTYSYPAYYSPKLIVSNGIDSGVKIRVNYITAGTVFTPTTIPQPTAAWRPGYNGTIFNMQGGSNVDMANSTYLKYWLQNFTATGNFSIYGFALGMLAPIMHVFGFWIFLIIWALYLFAVWIRSQDVTLPLIIGILTMGTFGLLFPKESLPVIIVMFAICGSIIIYKVAKGD